MNIDSFVEEILDYDKVKIVGLMMMAIKGDSESDILHQFEKLRVLRDLLE